MGMNEARYSGGKWLPVLGLGLAAVAAGAYLWLGRTPAPVVAPPAVQTAPAPQAPGVPAGEQAAGGSIDLAQGFPPPLADPAEQGEPLPALDESDAAVGEALSTLMGEGANLLVVSHLVRRIVVTVDNLPGEQLPLARAPLRPAEGSFRVAGEGEAMTIAVANAERYTPYVRLAEALPAERVVALYARFYPLFQAAYEELGYGPNAQFNDRLVGVIDHLLAAPQISTPIRLVQPKVRYHFADERLEGLSAGQKIMIRMGQDNATRIKARLREIRARLVEAGRGR